MIPKLCLKSLFAGRIEKFIAEKQALGYKYDCAYNKLRGFDKFCTDRFPTQSVLTQELFMEWAKRRKNEQNRTMRNRHAVIREFAKYLISMGEPAYVLPTNIVGFGAKSIPYVFTEEEILAFWETSDKLKSRHNSPYRHIVLPVMFRVIYCCGLRPQEVRHLAVDDIDLNNGKVFIRESKARRDRIVMMSDDVIESCRDYDKTIRILLPQRYAFFPCADGGFYKQDAFGSAFTDVWGKTGLQYRGHTRPSTYSFRHSFATHRLYKWMHEGKDLTTMLPYLSEYMGHTHLSSTYYYIHFVPGMFEMMSGVDYLQFQDLLPEVEDNE